LQAKPCQIVKYLFGEGWFASGMIDVINPQDELSAPGPGCKTG
jgi:hypothetical protein